MPLPALAGCESIYWISLIGPANSGKTTTMMHWINSQELDAIVGETTVSITTDNSVNANNRYNLLSKEMFLSKILPPPTNINEDIPVYAYSVAFTDSNGCKHTKVIALVDNSGEAVTESEISEFKIYGTDVLIFTLPADVLSNPLNGEYVRQCANKIIEGRELITGGNAQVIINITKADLLIDEFNHYEDYYNSIHVEDEATGKFKEVVHNTGFDICKFRKKENVIKDYLATNHRNFYNQLTNIPENKLNFTLSSCVGGEANTDGTIDSFKGLDSVSETLLLALNTIGAYPTKATNPELMEDNREIITRHVFSYEHVRICIDKFRKMFIHIAKKRR